MSDEEKIQLAHAIPLDVINTTIDAIYDGAGGHTPALEPFVMSLLIYLQNSDIERNEKSLSGVSNKLTQILLEHVELSAGHELAMSEQKHLNTIYRATINTLDVPIAMIDASGHLLSTNTAYSSYAVSQGSLNSELKRVVFKSKIDQRQLEMNINKLATDDKCIANTWKPLPNSKVQNTFYLFKGHHQNTLHFFLMLSLPTAIEHVVTHGKALFDFSEREAEVLLQILTAKTNVQIATAMNISVHTVDTHVKSLLSKTECRKKQELVQKVFLSYIPARSITKPAAYQLPGPNKALILADGRRLCYLDTGKSRGDR